MQLADIEVDLSTNEPEHNESSDGIPVVQTPVELPDDLPDVDQAQTVLISGIPDGGSLSQGWKLDADTWVVPPRHVHGLILKLPAHHSHSSIRMKFEVFGAVTSAFVSTTAVASDYEDIGTELRPDGNL